MLSTMMELFAYGPVGGIDPGAAIKWIIIWTVVLGGMLYASLFAKPWPDLDDH